jgi:hypothetical protein
MPAGTGVRCTATSKRTGEQCGRFVTGGGTVCKWHGGGAPQVRTSSARRLQATQATQILTRLGVTIEVAPLEALEAMLWESAGNVAVLRELVGALEPVSTRQGDWERGIEGRDGIYGPTYHESGKPTGEAKPHVLVVMYNEERDRLAKLAEACAKLGIDERRVRLAESQARDLFESVTRALSVIPVEHRDVFRSALADDLRTRHAALTR